MRRRFCAFGLLLLVTGMPVWGDVPLGPDAVIRELYDKWVQAAKAQRDAIAKDRKLLYSITEEITTPYIDFARLSRLVLGRYWRQASDEQRQRFMREFRAHLVRTYATAMFRYIDADFVFKPAKYKPGDRQVIVKTETIPGDGRPRFPMNYVVYRADSGWKAMDVTIEGISIVTTLRNIVRSEIQNKSLDGVIAELAEKNRRAVN